MDQRLGAWLRSVHLETSHDILERREAGIISATASTDLASLIMFAKLFHDIAISADLETRFRAYFFEKDRDFHMNGNSHELGVLGGACIAHALKNTNQQVRIGAALMAICPTVGFERKPTLPDLIGDAENVLEQESARQRQSPKAALETLTISGLEKQFAALKTVGPEGHHEQIAESVQSIANSLANAIRKCNNNTRRLNDQLDLYREESDILWWLTGSWSNELRTFFSTLAQDQAPIILGKELAALVRRLPGPASYDAFLRKAASQVDGNSGRKVGISACVEAIDTVVVRKWVEPFLSNPVMDLCPLHSAMRLYMESTNAAEWQTKFFRIYKLNASTNIAVHSLARQAYLESLLLRFSVNFVSEQ